MARNTAGSVKADLGLVLTTIIWGTTFPLIRESVQNIEPAWFVAIRFSITFLIFIPIALSHGLGTVLAEFKRAKWGAFLLGALAWTSYLTQTIGLQTISAGRAAFITGTCVVIVPLISPFFGKERPERCDWVAVAFATAGLFLLTRPDLGGASLVGDAWVLVCAVVCALYIRFLPMFATGSKSQHTFNLMQILAVITLAWVTLPVTAGPLPAIAAPTWKAILFCAIVATTLTFMLQTRFQPLTTPERAAIIFALEPVWGSLFGYLWLGETFTGTALWGAALILASVVGLEAWKARRALSIATG
jgi:drug/metabolite transporter (DMT)-like permease